MKKISIPIIAFFLYCLIGFSALAKQGGDTLLEIKEEWKRGLTLIVKPRNLPVTSCDLYYWYGSGKDADVRCIHADTSGSFSIKNVILDTTIWFKLSGSVIKRVKNSDAQSYRIGSLSEHVNAIFSASDSVEVPEFFSNGRILLNKGTVPGGVFMVDPFGKVEWKMVSANYAVKVVKLTDDNTLLAILGSEEDQTSYGRRVVEITAGGDTLMDLSNETAGFGGAPHHEILKTKDGKYIFLIQEKRIFDLSKLGGTRSDTVTGDGILIVDKSGRRQWSWSVFDHLNPLQRDSIVRIKDDWTHANGLSYDADGNYLLSFLNLAQVWKINSTTGKVMWKFGKKGNIEHSPDDSFGQLHTFHLDERGYYLFYDNGLKGMRSSVKAFSIDQEKLTADLMFKIVLPKEGFSPRMGSAYQLSDSLFLSCASKANNLLLTDRSGNVLWKMKTNIGPYRGEFISEKQFKQFLNTK